MVNALRHTIIPPSQSDNIIINSPNYPNGYPEKFTVFEITIPANADVEHRTIHIDTITTSDIYEIVWYQIDVADFNWGQPCLSNDYIVNNLTIGFPLENETKKYNLCFWCSDKDCYIDYMKIGNVYQNSTLITKIIQIGKLKTLEGCEWLH